MTAQEARAIVEKNKSIPTGIRFILNEIKRHAKDCETEMVCREVNEQQREWLEKNGYKIEETDTIFYAGSPSQKAIKITW